MGLPHPCGSERLSWTALHVRTKPKCKSLVYGAEVVSWAGSGWGFLLMFFVPPPQARKEHAEQRKNDKRDREPRDWMICVMKNMIGKGKEGEVKESRMRHYQKGKKQGEKHRTRYEEENEIRIGKSRNSQEINKNLPQGKEYRHKRVQVARESVAEAKC